VLLHNGATLVPAKVGNGVRIDASGEYVSFDDHKQTCFGNLDLSPNGITGSLYVNFQKLADNGYLLDAGPYSIYTKGEKVNLPSLFIVVFSCIVEFDLYQFYWQLIRIVQSFLPTSHLTMYIYLYTHLFLCSASNTDKTLKDYNR